MTVFGLKWGQDFWEPGGTPHHEFPGVHPPDSIVGNYSKHPLIERAERTSWQKFPAFIPQNTTTCLAKQDQTAL